MFDPLQLSALGRDVRVGDLYNYYDDSILPAASQVPKEFIQMEIKPIAQTVRSIFPQQPDKFKCTLLGISSHLEQSIQQGSINLDNLWFANYIKPNLKEEDSSAQVIAYFKIVRMTQTLDQHFLNSKLYDYQLISGGKATHIVEQVVYGAEFIFSMRRDVDLWRETKESAEDNICRAFKTFFDGAYCNSGEPAELDNVSCTILCSLEAGKIVNGSVRQFLMEVDNFEKSQFPIAWRPIEIVLRFIPSQMDTRLLLDKMNDIKTQTERSWHLVLKESRKLSIHPFIKRVPPFEQVVSQFRDLLQPLWNQIETFYANTVIKTCDQEKIVNNLTFIANLLYGMNDWLFLRRCEIDIISSSFLNGTQLTMLYWEEIKKTISNNKCSVLFILKVDYKQDLLMEHIQKSIGHPNPSFKLPVFPIITAENLEEVRYRFRQFVNQTELGTLVPNRDTSYHIALVSLSSSYVDGATHVIRHPIKPLTANPLLLSLSALHVSVTSLTNPNPMVNDGVVEYKQGRTKIDDGDDGVLSPTTSSDSANTREKHRSKRRAVSVSTIQLTDVGTNSIEKNMSILETDIKHHRKRRSAPSTEIVSVVDQSRKDLSARKKSIYSNTEASTIKKNKFSVESLKYSLSQTNVEEITNKFTNIAHETDQNEHRQLMREIRPSNKGIAKFFAQGSNNGCSLLEKSDKTNSYLLNTRRNSNGIDLLKIKESSDEEKLAKERRKLTTERKSDLSKSLLSRETNDGQTIRDKNQGKEIIQRVTDIVGGSETEPKSTDRSDNFVFDRGYPSSVRIAEFFTQDARFSQIIKNGQPSVYLLNALEHSIGENFRWLDIGLPNGAPQTFGLTDNHKVIILMGATGSGKSTLINGIVNYILGVQWNDPFRFKCVREDQSESRNQAHSQTSSVTAYTIHHQEGLKIPYSITIIDTPGYGDTRGVSRDKEISRIIHEFLMQNNSIGIRIDQINAACFVAASGDSRLTVTQRYIVDSVLSIFGKDFKNNIRLLVTFADNSTPPVVEACRAANFPVTSPSTGITYSKFNSSVLYTSNKQEGNENFYFDKLFWDMGQENFQNFCIMLEGMEGRDLKSTREVIQHRNVLEQSLKAIEREMEICLIKIENIETFQRKMREHNHKNLAWNSVIEKAEMRLVQVKCDKSFWAYNCLKCQKTCDAGIKMFEKVGDIKSRPMCRKRVCLCPDSEHEFQQFEWRMGSVMTRTSLLDMKAEYESMYGRTMTNQQLLAECLKDLELTKLKITSLLKQVGASASSLDSNALRSNALSPADYLSLMRSRVAEEQAPGYLTRLETLAELQHRLAADISPINIPQRVTISRCPTIEREITV